MLELATLGLLQNEPLHGYRLKQQLERFMSGCISVNYGAIYPMLKRLEQQGEITTLTTEAGGSGPSRKIYCITAAGKIKFQQKMLEYPHESWVNARSRFMIKFFFFSHLQSAQRLKLIEHRLMVCRLRLEAKESEATTSTDSYQIALRQRSIAVLTGEINWLVQQLAQEQRLRSAEHEEDTINLSYR